MLLLTLIIPDAFGGGDIKLMAVAGFMLGFANTLLATFIALLFGGGVAIYTLMQKKRANTWPLAPIFAWAFTLLNTLAGQ